MIAAWMLPNDGRLSDAQRVQAVDNFIQYIRRNSITPAQVGHQLGRPKATTIAELMKHKFRDGSDAHVRRLNLWVEQHARAKAASLTDTFVTTLRVAKDMLSVARLVSENQTLGLVYGPSGIGKSRCALAIHDKYVGSVYVSIIPGYHHPKGLTHRLAVKLGVRAQYVGTRDAVYSVALSMRM